MYQEYDLEYQGIVDFSPGGHFLGPPKILELIQIQLDSGKTLVISTHQPEWAKPLKPRICLLEYGRIASDTLWN